MAWRNKWANATPIKTARGKPEPVITYHAAKKSPESKKKTPGLFIGLACVAVALIALAVVLLPKIAGSSKTTDTSMETAAALEETATTEVPVTETSTAEETETPIAAVEVTATPAPAREIQAKNLMTVLAYESTDGFPISNLECAVLGKGSTASFEITVTWEDNKEVNAIKGFSNQSVPYEAQAIATFQKDYYKMTGQPLVTSGAITQTQTAYHGVVPVAGPIYLLFFCFDAEGEIIAYISVDVDYPEESAG